ncbi:hypothetical protein IWQ60_010644, partial [Tieghemiomyces parasiticus]
MNAERQRQELVESLLPYQESFRSHDVVPSREIRTKDSTILGSLAIHDECNYIAVVETLEGSVLYITVSLGGFQ